MMRIARRLLLPVIVLLVHGPYVGFGFTSLDDLTLIASDQAFLTSAGVWWRAFARSYFYAVEAAHSYFRPVVTLSYALDARLFGAAAGGYHATNVLLHLGASWLVWGLFCRAKLSGAVATVASVLFAVHPVVVPAVAWIPGRNDSLLAVLSLSSILAYGEARAGARAARWRALHLATFALAMFTKETAVVVPLLALAWGRCLPQDESSARQRCWRVAAHALGWASVIALFFAARHQALPGPWTPSLDVAAALRRAPLLVASAGKLLFPVNLAPIATLEDTTLWPGALSLALAASLIALVVRRGGKPRTAVLVFGGALCVLPLVPTLFVGGSLALENRLYLPTAGALLVVAELLDHARIERALFLAFACVTAAAFAALTFGGASAYRDPLSFGKAAVAGAPRSALARFTLGQARQLRGDLDAAMGDYATALAIDPREPIVRNNIAVVHMRRGDWARAEAALLAELAVNPGYGAALQNLAIVRDRLSAKGP